MGKNPHC